MPLDRACAVVGCGREGRRQICPYDGRYHWHGRVHYTPGDAGLVFHPEEEKGWKLICDQHYQDICDWLEARREA